ncbi:NlpC/P60 family protein [Paenibacillus caui]|uniref:C40 family peptidase n=1 Tax=Paenibacillus caui TaxID=2873927 RepID=UPI001CA8594A|nr:NlpC/P60 family protein [Paenibacillus caui]
MSTLSKMRTAVSVATVWTTPESPRPLDEPALQQPALLAEWIGAMTVPDKLDLYNGNRIQTQLLYGTEVLAAEQRGDWIKVFIPDQATRKEALGYPGWVPKCQLAASDEHYQADKWAEVIADKAQLILEGNQDTTIELSFLTRLPVLAEAGESVTVHSPHGTAVLQSKDVRIISGSASASPDAGQIGQRIVEQGMRFLGLPYLWGGMSSFGYDCSGFAYSMHKSQGIIIPRDASDQARQGEVIERDELQPGDLLFFAFEKGKGNVHHVGIYAGDNHMLHSPDSSSCIELIPLEGYKLADEHCISRRYR